MARNFVEYHIQEGAFHTFKVTAGQTIKIGQLVSISGDRSVSVAGAGSKAIGVVYSGTVGKDGINVGYLGSEGDVVTVIVLKPLVYLQAGGTIVAGDTLSAGASGKAVKFVESGTYVANSGDIVIGTALEGAVLDARFLAVLR